jgi:hypothetical protein
MSFGFPLGLLALGALLPLVAAYFLRRKQPPVKVSALFLWRVPQPQAQAGPRFQRFSRELSLLLEALAIVTASLFLADLRCGKEVEKRHLVVVVDGSLSMSAAPNGGPPVPEQVRRAVAKLADREGASALTLVETGASPRVLAGPQEDVSRALAALEAWTPLGASHEVAPALLLAKELAGPGRRLHFVTDGLPGEGEPLPPEVRVAALGQAVDNVAFVSAQRRDEGEVATLTVRVANFSPSPRAVTVSFQGMGEAPEQQALRQQQKLELPAGGSEAVRVAFRNAGPVEVTVPQDALAVDGRLTLLPSPARAVTLGLLPGLPSAEGQALRRFAQVASGVTLEGETPELTFGARGSQAQVTMGAPGKQRSFVGPFFAAKGHPVLEDVELSGVVWTAGENPPGRPLLTAGPSVLLSEEGNTLHLNLDLGRSNLTRTAAWPILLGNVVQRARARMPGLPRPHVMLGEEVSVVTEPGVRYALEGPDGTRPVLGTGLVSVPAFRQPGRYRLLRDGKPQGELEVLPIDPRESDLRARGTGEVAATAGSSAPSQTQERRAPWPLVVMLALLLADFAVTRRGGS